jgi:hypothetical protein
MHVYNMHILYIGASDADAEGRAGIGCDSYACPPIRYSVYLLYKYTKSTHTDAITSTKVQILPGSYVILAPVRRSGVSICTFVLAKQAN